MIIIHTDNGNRTSGDQNIRIIRPERKDWVRFDSEEDDQTTQRLNVQLDMDKFDSVEIFVKKCVQTSKKNIFSCKVLEQNLEYLEQSGFYYRYDTAETCTKLLSKTSPGSFLVRDSSDPHYIFTLSLQTDRGPTSVRLVFIDGEFRLDAADQRLTLTLPGFKTVLQLLQYYVVNGKRSSSSNKQVWIDSTTGRTHSSVKLIKPLRHTVPSLKHLTRLALNESNCDTQKLPDSVKRYLNSYPFIL